MSDEMNGLADRLHDRLDRGGLVMNDMAFVRRRVRQTPPGEIERDRSHPPLIEPSEQSAPYGRSPERAMDEHDWYARCRAGHRVHDGSLGNDNRRHQHASRISETRSPRQSPTIMPHRRMRPENRGNLPPAVDPPQREPITGHETEEQNAQREKDFQSRARFRRDCLKLLRG
jgi:hypothetical protein